MVDWLLSLSKHLGIARGPTEETKTIVAVVDPFFPEVRYYDNGLGKLPDNYGEYTERLMQYLKGIDRRSAYVILFELDDPEYPRNKSLGDRLRGLYDRRTRYIISDFYDTYTIKLLGDVHFPHAEDVYFLGSFEDECLLGVKNRIRESNPHPRFHDVEGLIINAREAESELWLMDRYKKGLSLEDAEELYMKADRRFDRIRVRYSGVFSVFRKHMHPMDSKVLDDAIEVLAELQLEDSVYQQFKQAGDIRDTLHYRIVSLLSDAVIFRYHSR